MALIGGMLAVSCQDSSSSMVGEIQYLAVQTETGGRWGMVGSDGQLLFEDEFINEPTAVANGYFSVKEGEYYSLYSAAAKPKLVRGCDDLASVGFFKDGIIPVAHADSRITFIDGNGEVKATLNPVNGKEIVECSVFSNEGLFLFKTEDGKYGFVDKRGNIAIMPKYESVSLFSEGLAMVMSEKEDGAIYIAIDKKGEEVFRLKKDIHLANALFYEGLLAAYNEDERWGFVDRKGQFAKVSGKVKAIGNYNSDLFTFKSEEGLWGVMDMKGETLIRAKYDEVQLLSDGNFLVKDGEKSYIMDKKAEKLQTIEDYVISNVIEMGKLLLIGKDKSTYILMDKQGKPIGKEEFKGINTKILQSPSVTSDYFNYDSVVQDLLSGLKSNGIGKYTLNMPVTQLGIADYDSYTYSYTYRDPGERESHWKYSVETSVYTNNPIAVREYSGYNSKVIANPEAKVETITKAVNADVDCWKKLRDKIIAKLESEGFKKVEETDDTIIFTGKNCHLIVDANSSGKYISLKMTAL